MSTTATSDGLVVVMGDPTDITRDYINHLDELARTGDTDFWKVPKGAEVGDLVLVYLTRPVSAIAAFGTVLSDPVETNAAPDRHWGAGWFAEVGCFGVLDQPITRDELLGEVPEWRWPVQPHTATLPRGEAAQRLIDHVASKSLEFRLLDAANSTMLVENDVVYQIVELEGSFLVTRVTIDEIATAVPAVVVARAATLEEAFDAMVEAVYEDAPDNSVEA